MVELWVVELGVVELGVVVTGASALDKPDQTIHLGDLIPLEQVYHYGMTGDS